MLANNQYHVPVLLKETLEFLKVEEGKKYLDATLGGGGHSRKIVSLGGELLGIDQDPEAVAFAQKVLSACPAMNQMVHRHCPPPKVVKANFSQIDEIAAKEGFEKVDGILFDLGVSSHQLDTESRGFSFIGKSALDMRMDPLLAVTAKDLVNGLNEGELAELFAKLGEERYSRRYAQAICLARQAKPIETGVELAEIIVRAAPKRGKAGKIHPATRVFQALRIAVNDELNNLRQALPKAFELLNLKGRLVVISFHSLEDKIVKEFFLQKEKTGELKLLTKKPLVPGREEIAKNPRARSAKLRTGERIK